MANEVRLIECRDCDEKNCNGCNIYTLAEMLCSGVLDCLMDEHHCITIAPESLRPKGRWEPIVDMVWNLDTPVLQGWRCSECGRTEQFKEPYCNCGAKMEG